VSRAGRRAAPYPWGMTTNAPSQAVRTLLAGVVDYAGLFPPASLEMPPAVENFARYHMGEHEWMLGRFICPASRLDELSKHAATLMPGTFATSGYREHAGYQEPWRVSVIADQPLEQCLRSIVVFNERHGEEVHGRAVADALELKTSEVRQVEAALDIIPDEVFPFFELPADADVRGMVAALAGSAAGAKIRTGGVTADAIPSSERLASFIHTCSAAEVPFKATAGLHHPLRGEHRLTYDLDSPSGTMHGFLNVFIAASLVKQSRISPDQTGAILEERDADAFHFGEETVGWRGQELELVHVAKARESFALSFGSCSFQEPVDDLKSLGLL
jgi:hypothetical protein